MTNVEERTEETTGEERPSRPENCDAPDVRPLQEIVDNLPYGAVVLLGAAILWMGAGAGVWRWLAPALFIAYGVAGTVWIMAFICPYCHFYDTRLCPCGYGRIAPKLRARKGPDGFARQFRRHIPMIVPLWFIPLVAGIVFLVNNFSWLLLAVLVLFAVNSFVVLPLVSREYGCARCPQKDACPWMAKCRSSHSVACQWLGATLSLAKACARDGGWHWRLVRQCFGGRPAGDLDNPRPSGYS